MQSLKVPTPSEIQESVVALADAWEQLVLDYGSGDISNKNGIAIRWANSAFPFYNTLTVLNAPGDRGTLMTTLTSCSEYIRGRDKPGLLWFFEELLPTAIRSDLLRMAQDAGLSLSLTGYGMVLDAIPQQIPSHPELTFVRVDGEDDLLSYADINCEAYSMPTEWGRDALSGSELWSEKAFAYLGVKNGVPVSAAATIKMEGQLFLALVATRPDQQRRGYGEATVRKALYEGWKATGLSRSVLHATEAGRPVYERIGYRETSTIRFLGPKP